MGKQQMMKYRLLKENAYCLTGFKICNRRNLKNLNLKVKCF